MWIESMCTNVLLKFRHKHIKWREMENIDVSLMSVFFPLPLSSNNNESWKHPQCYSATWRSRCNVPSMEALRLTWSDRSATVVSLVRSSWARGGPAPWPHQGCPWLCWWTKAPRSSGCGREPSPVPKTVTRKGRTSHNQVQAKNRKLSLLRAGIGFLPWSSSLSGLQGWVCCPPPLPWLWRSGSTARSGGPPGSHGITGDGGGIRKNEWDVRTKMHT